MQIVKHRPVAVHRPRGIPGEHIAAVIADGLDGGAGAEDHALPGAQPGHLAGNHKGQDVEEEGFEPVGVDGAVGVRDVEAVVLGVHEAVKGAVDVAEAVGEVDPRVDDDEGEGVLGGRVEVIEGESREGEFEGCWGVVGDCGGATDEELGEGWAGAGGREAESFGVDAEGGQEDGDDVSEAAEGEGGGVGSAGFVADHGWAAAVVQDETDGDLHDVVADDGFEAFPFGDVVPLEFLFGRVDAVIAEDSVGVEDVEEGCGDGIDDGW